MRRLSIAIALAGLAMSPASGPALASPRDRSGVPVEDYAVLLGAARDIARVEERQAAHAAAVLARRRIIETEQALAAWGSDRPGSGAP